MTIYTRRGDDGTTGLLGGVRVRKDEPRIELLGTLDEAQAHLGVARAECGEQTEVAQLIEAVERDLWIVMAGVASPRPVGGLVDAAGGTVDAAMVQRLEDEIDRYAGQTDLAPAFAVPGENRLSAALDVARTVIRRAERLAVTVLDDAAVLLAYLNRLSDLCWIVARSVETERATNHRGGSR